MPMPAAATHFEPGPAIGKELAYWIATRKVAADFAQLTLDGFIEGRLSVQDVRPTVQIPSGVVLAWPQFSTEATCLFDR
jgi:hypothetical protein